MPEVLQKQISCPITGSEDTELLVAYNQTVTSDSHLISANVENRISRSTGLIFNATGTRGTEKAFYTDEYDLHSENVLSEFMVYDQSGVRGIYDEIVDFIESAGPLPETGRILDIGCGKGLLLKRFFDQYPGWQLFAIEPSQNAQQYFATIMPQVEVFNGNFENSPYVNQTFDLILANGVLEHVPNPLQFLTHYRKCLGKTGKGYLGVPNFENNPADLFTYDHLSRFTPSSLEGILAQSGFSIIHRMVPLTRVPMFYLIQADAPRQTDFSSIYEESKALAARSIAFIDSVFDAYSRCAQSADAENGRIGMYGTGTIGLLGTVYSMLTANRITAIFDDNPTIWGSQRLGITIHNPADLHSLGITHMVISANPCYIPTICEKIRAQAGDHIKIFV